MISESVLSRGLDNAAMKRLLFRLNFIEEAFYERMKVLNNGNIASPYPEIAQLAHITADLCNTMKEFLTLVEISQQEQGQRTPLNDGAPSTETPVTTPNPA